MDVLPPSHHSPDTRTITLTPYNRTPYNLSTGGPTLYIDHVAFAPLAVPYGPRSRCGARCDDGRGRAVQRSHPLCVRRLAAAHWCTSPFQEVIQVTHPYLSRQDHRTLKAIPQQPDHSSAHRGHLLNAFVTTGCGHICFSQRRRTCGSREGGLHYSGTRFGALTASHPPANTI